MKNLSLKVIFGIVALALIVGVVKIIAKIVTGAFGLVSGLLNTILAVVVIVALIVIVCWMFSYAAKKNK